MALAYGQNTASTAINASTEATCVTSSTLAIVPGGTYAGLAIRGNINVTQGTAGSSGVLRVRQGAGTAGTVVGNPMTVSTTALSTYDFAYDVVDTTATPFSQYTFTFTSPSASGADGKVNFAEIEIDPVVP